MSADKPVRVAVEDVSRLAYSMASRGDLRLVQQLALVRNSGVRINERESSRTDSTETGFEFRIPFVEYKNTTRTSTSVVERFTPELGQTRTAIESFNKEYLGIFGEISHFYVPSDKLPHVLHLHQTLLPKN